ncbi:P-loop containing nucleoside triphosphate hydrolase protein [Flagelloscypha sp. PMI_526]|nr:P-loop containing nucleoside triphosphate hydrolase protein [Flagelloscypha sp. PMI_526]
MLCPLPTRHFTGRKEEIQILENHFRSSREPCTMAVLYGIGGSGKTQIALEFIQRSFQLNIFSAVFFVDASNQSTLENGLDSIAIGTSNTRPFDLHESGGNWLLVLDNADDPTLDLRPYLLWNHGNVLITTRNREVCTHAPDCSIRIDCLDLKDAIELLLKGVSFENDRETQETVFMIIRELGALPLAVTQARAFLARGMCTLKEYMSLYMQNHRQLLQEKTIQTTDAYQNAVFTTWTISFNKLSSTAAFLLRLLSYMHHDGIPSRLFEDAWKSLGSLNDGEVPSTLVTFLLGFTAEDLTWNAPHFHQLIRELLSFSLIELDERNDMISLHPLIQKRVLDISHVYSPDLFVSTQALLCLATTIGEITSDYSIRRSLLPHIRRSMSAGPQVHNALLSSISLLYRDFGLDEERLAIHEKLTSEMREALGDEHPN